MVNPKPVIANNVPQKRIDTEPSASANVLQHLTIVWVEFFVVRDFSHSLFRRSLFPEFQRINSQILIVFSKGRGSEPVPRGAQIVAVPQEEMGSGIEGESLLGEQGGINLEVFVENERLVV